MSDLGAIGTNLHRATKLLEPYISALRDVKSRGGCVERPDEARSFLAVLNPLSRHLRGKTYFVLGINGEDMSEFLRLRHRERWPSIKDGIISVESKLEEGAGGRVDLFGEDVSILGYVSEALDNECASMFKEMRRRRTFTAWSASSEGRSTGPSSQGPRFRTARGMRRRGAWPPPPHAAPRSGAIE